MLDVYWSLCLIIFCFHDTSTVIHVYISLYYLIELISPCLSTKNNWISEYHESKDKIRTDVISFKIKLILFEDCYYTFHKINLLLYWFCFSFYVNSFKRQINFTVEYGSPPSSRSNLYFLRLFTSSCDPLY